MPRPRTDRPLVHGPYRHGQRFRLVAKLGADTIEARSYPTEAAAETARPRFQAELDAAPAFTVREALGQWLEARCIEGYGAGHRATSEHGITVLLQELDVPLSDLTPARLKSSYQALTRTVSRFGKPLSPATHRDWLSRCRVFLAWCVEQGWLRGNPAAEIKGTGRMQKGAEKPQLSREQARRFLDAALARAASPEARRAQTGVAAALVLLLGNRSSEVLTRRVQDLDEGCTILRVVRGKTAQARRELEIPEVVQPYLQRLAAGRRAGDLLLPGHAADMSGREVAHDRAWLWRNVREICEEADVPVISPQGMRRTFATVGMQASQIPHLVSAALGHASSGAAAVTTRSYADRREVEREHGRRVLGVLDGGKK